MTAMVWLNKPPATPCLGEPQIASNVHSIQAMKVCRSTLGRPSIKFTGISMVPARYKDDGRYATRLRVDRFVPRLPSQGVTSKKAHVATRPALWFLVSGTFGDLRTPRKWTLMIVERRS